jgi:hypothetical protein
VDVDARLRDEDDLLLGDISWVDAPSCDKELTVVLLRGCLRRTYLDAGTGWA